MAASELIKPRDCCFSENCDFRSPLLYHSAKKQTGSRLWLSPIQIPGKNSHCPLRIRRLQKASPFGGRSACACFMHQLLSKQQIHCHWAHKSENACLQGTQIWASGFCLQRFLLSLVFLLNLDCKKLTALLLHLRSTLIWPCRSLHLVPHLKKLYILCRNLETPIQTLFQKTALSLLNQMLDTRRNLSSRAQA